ncbi:uncharacterized protein G2W53_000325 [Senna tora]|uniref:Uncharacterized protein n=1 Tax=Senna tora TaxID=362788 RepID=A0A835CKH5_9FABA|nr:uncharacterized protein G2W53_000325 [Senna tora]
MVVDPWKMELLSVGDEEGGDVGSSTTQKKNLLQLWMRNLLGVSIKRVAGDEFKTETLKIEEDALSDSMKIKTRLWK